MSKTNKIMGRDLKYILVYIIVFTLVVIFNIGIDIEKPHLKTNYRYPPHPTTYDNQSHIIYTSLWGERHTKDRKVVENLVYSIANNVNNATLKIFVDREIGEDLKYFVSYMKFIQIIHCNKLVKPGESTRFQCYQDEINKENPKSKFALVDAADVHFLGDIFHKITEPLHLVQEPAHHPMSKCKWHKMWITQCPSYGMKTWNRINSNSMICAGTIFGTGAGLKDFLKVFVRKLKQTQCNDQGMLNILVYTGVIKPTLWPHEDKIVLSMNVAKEYNYDGAYVVHTGDNPNAVTTMISRDELLFKDVLSYEESSKAKGLLLEFHKVMERNNIDYIIDGGTLIGAMLHQQRIPWDDDMDVYIYKWQLDRLSTVLKKTNLQLVSSYDGLYYKVYCKCHQKVKNNRHWNWPFIDIGLIESDINNNAWEVRSKDPKYKNHRYKENWLFPARDIWYEGVRLRGPNNPEAFLDHRFGKDWDKKCVYNNWDHKLEKVRYPSLGDGNKQVIKQCDSLKWLPTATAAT